jgi:DNA-binding transcriptional LysR family regulator
MRRLPSLGAKLFERDHKAIRLTQAGLQLLPRLLDQPLDARLDLWPNWLAKAGRPARHADNGIEFSTLEQAIRAASKGAGLPVVDRNLIVEELANASLAQFSDVEVSGPFGYWLDIPQRHVELEHVQALAEWLWEVALRLDPQ